MLYQKTFFQIAAVIFALVTFLHVLRVLLGWEAVIGGWNLPMWVSFIAPFVSGYLAYNAFKFAGK